MDSGTGVCTGEVFGLLTAEQFEEYPANGFKAALLILPQQFADPLPLHDPGRTILRCRLRPCSDLMQADLVFRRVPNNGYSEFRHSGRTRHALQRVNGAMTLVEPKTAGSARSIDLPAITLAALSAHKSRQQSDIEWAGSGWKGNDWNLVFTTSVGTPLDERKVLGRFQDKILPKAGVQKMRFMTFATLPLRS